MQKRPNLIVIINGDRGFSYPGPNYPGFTVFMFLLKHYCVTRVINYFYSGLLKVGGIGMCLRVLV